MRSYAYPSGFFKVFSHQSHDNPDLTGVAHWGEALHRQSLAKQGLEEFQDRHSRGEVPIGVVSEGSRWPSKIIMDFVMEILLVI